MQVLHDRFANDPAVDVIALNIDESAESAARAARFLEDEGHTYRWVPDGGQVFRDFGLRLIPTFLVIGPDGSIVHRHTGRLTDEARDEVARQAEAAAAADPG